MKAKKQLILIAPALALALAVAPSFPKAVSLSAAWSDFVPGDAHYGDTYSVPTMSYEWNGTTYPASCIVTYPDGTETSYSSLTLSMAGEYILTYSVQVGDKILSIEESLFVEYPQYSVSRSTSSLSYGTPENAITKGVMVSLANGDALRFTKPIPVKDLTSDNIIVKGYITPSNYGSADFSELILTLTDASDPTNYVNFKYYSHAGETNSYSSGMAQTNGNFYAGVHQSQGLHTNDTYGTWTPVVFDGVNPVSYGSTAYDASYFTFMLDHDTKKTYGSGFERGRSNALTPVLDLDDPAQVSVPWSGFSSDSVFLSISAASYSAATANFVVSSVLGIDDLSDNVYFDDVAPTVSLQEGFDEMPSGSVGYSYPIPSASAIDLISGEAEVTTAVYYNYFSASPISVAIQNHSFYMDRPGAYSIVYEAKDRIGNSSKIVKTVNVFSDLGKPSFELPSLPDSLAVGSYLPLSKSVDVTGGSGDSSISIRVEHDGVSEEVEEGYRFTTLSTHRIVYTATDYIGQKSERSFEITPYDGKLPILEDAITLPRFLIEGGTYDLPESKCYLYQDGALQKFDVSYAYSDSTGTHETSSSFAPKVVSQGESIPVTASYNGVELQKETIPAVKAWGTSLSEGAINLSNYFIGDSSERTLLEEGMQIAYNGNPNMGFSYANPLLLDSFSATIESVKGASVGNAITLTFTDADHSANSISASILKKEDATYLSFGGKETALIGLDMGEDVNYPIAFDGQTLSIGAFSLSLDEPLSFASDKAYLDVTYEGAHEGSSFLVYDLCTYVFRSTVTTDRIRPLISAPGEHGGCKEIGSTLSIGKAYVGDVLAPNCDMTLSVTGPDQQPVKDKDGEVLEGVDPSKARDIVLDQYGQYYFLYTASESSSFLSRSNKATLSYYVNVLDEVAPEIKVTGTIPETAKVGDIVYFPSFEVTDNVTEAKSITVIKTILSPNGDTFTLAGDENGIKVGLVGTYRFHLFAIDEAGNVSSRTFLVTVSEAQE